MSCKTALTLVLVMFALTGCAADPSMRTENAMGGVLAGAAAGGAIGLVCCGDPVHGAPAGILIGGVVGGAAGLLWPEKSRQ